MAMFDTLKQRLFRAKTRANTFFIQHETIGSVDLFEILKGAIEEPIETIGALINQMNEAAQGGDKEITLTIDLRKLPEIRKNVLENMPSEEQAAAEEAARAQAEAAAKLEEALAAKAKAEKQPEDLTNLSEDDLFKEEPETAAKAEEEESDDGGEKAPSLPETWRELLIEMKSQAKRFEREVGFNALYVGLPIIEGKIADGSEYFKAPLFFAEAIIKRKNIFYVELIIDCNQIMLNPVIASVISAKSGEQFDVNEYEYYNKIDIMDAFEKLENIGLVFHGEKEFDENAEITPFNFISRNEFKEEIEAKDNIIVTPHVLLGVFELYGNNIFWDFNNMLNEAPEVMDELLESERNLTFDYFKFDNKFRTNKIHLFSAIDIQQQLAVAHALEGNVIIEGPPGTGKSESLANVIVNIILAGKTALLVAEKKAAMDVIYNRLGDYAYNILYISDLKKDRKLFFQQFRDLEKYFNETSQKLKYKNNEFHVPEIDVDVNEKLIESIWERYRLVSKFLDRRFMFMGKEHTFLDLLNAADSSLDVEPITCEKINDFFLWSLQNVASLDVEANQERMLKLCQEQLGYQYDWNVLTELADAWESKRGMDDDKFAAIVRTFQEKGRVDINVKVRSIWGKQLVDLSPQDYEFSKRVSSLVKLIPQVTENIEKAELPEEMQKGLLDQPLKWFATWVCRKVLIDEVKQIDKIQAGIEKDIHTYITATKKSVEITEDLLRKAIVINFENVYRNNEKEVKDLMRQADVEKQKEVMWWVKRNFDILYDLYPIHMMSVDSVSTALETKHGMYDYIICDEASQVFLEKALPSLYRGKRYIISGDVKQLQPSNFFGGQIKQFEDDSEEDKINYNDLSEAVSTSSLMHFFKNRASSNIMLRYHYRALFNELIEFSNQKFYDGKLLMTSKAVKKQKPIVVHDVEEAVWTKGNNFLEAKAVVAHILDMSLTPDYKKSVGVITFNAKQQQTIETLLDRAGNNRVAEWRERISPKGEFIGLFIKNIENVQGDERDIILFSVGYDRTVTNYGPLSTAGGENRLNVAVSRAKERIEVFKSEPAKVLYGFESSMPGPKLFVYWLLFCEHVSKIDPTINDQSANYKFETPFEQIIYTYLRKRLPANFQIGYKVTEGSYLLDFVIYQDMAPKAAIECNGKLHSDFASFREADIYRKWFLTSRGWDFYRIWQTQWVIDEQMQQSLLDKFLIQLIKGEQEEEKVVIQKKDMFDFSTGDEMDFEIIDRRINKLGEAKSRGGKKDE